MRVLGRGVVAVVLAATVATTGLAAPVAADDAGPTATWLLLRQTEQGLRYSGCAEGVELPGPAGAGGLTVPAQTQEIVDGRVVELRDDALAFDLPLIDGEDPPCAGNVFVTGIIRPDEFADAGVTPAPGEWAPFRLELRVEVQGQVLTWSRATVLGAGPVTGALESVTTTPEGARVRGWAVRPDEPTPVQLWITVDGRTWNDDEPFPPESWRNLDRILADDPSDGRPWHDANIGADHDFDLVVPFGRICILARPSGAPLAAPLAEATLLGCRTSGSDGRRTARIEQIALTPAANRVSMSMTVSGYIVDPYSSGMDEPPAVGLSARPELGPWDGSVVASAPRPDISGPQADGSGAFGFSKTFHGLRDGLTTVCVRDHSPTFPEALGAEWAPKVPGPDQHCREVYVPAAWPSAPRGALESVSVAGRDVTVTGWAVDRNGGHPRVLISSNGLPVAVLRADRGRRDVLREVGGDGRSGFRSKLRLAPGSHKVCVQWEDTDEGTWHGLTCRTVVVK